MHMHRVNELVKSKLIEGDLAFFVDAEGDPSFWGSIISEVKEYEKDGTSWKIKVEEPIHTGGNENNTSENKYIVVFCRGKNIVDKSVGLTALNASVDTLHIQ